MIKLKEGKERNKSDPKSFSYKKRRWPGDQDITMILLESGFTTSNLALTLMLLKLEIVSLSMVMSPLPSGTVLRQSLMLNKPDLELSWRHWLIMVIQSNLENVQFFQPVWTLPRHILVLPLHKAFLLLLSSNPGILMEQFECFTLWALGSVDLAHWYPL